MRRGRPLLDRNDGARPDARRRRALPLRRQAPEGPRRGDAFEWNRLVSGRHPHDYIDSPVQRVDLFDFELASGQIDDRRQFVSIDERDGIPDGLTLDDEGGVWVALYGGSRVHRYDESGQLDAVLKVPAKNVTSCCFGGDDGRSLFVTTAAPD